MPPRIPPPQAPIASIPIALACPIPTTIPFTFSPLCTMIPAPTPCPGDGSWNNSSEQLIHHIPMLADCADCLWFLLLTNESPASTQFFLGALFLDPFTSPSFGFGALLTLVFFPAARGLVQLAEDGWTRQQGPRWVALEQDAVIHDEHAVVINDRVQPVRHSEHSVLGEAAADELLHHFVGFGIDSVFR